MDKTKTSKTTFYKERYSDKENALKKNLLWLNIGFFSSLTPFFSVHPFGLSFLCAANSNHLPILTGIAASAAFGALTPIELFCDIFIAIAKYLLSTESVKKIKKKQNQPLSLAVKTSFAFLYALITMIYKASTDSVTPLLVQIIRMIIIPVIAFFICGLFQKQNIFGHIHKKAALVCLSCGAVFLVSKIKIGIFSLPFIISSVVTLAAAEYSGVVFGGMAGFISSFASNIASIPTLGASGIISGVFFRISKVAGLISFFVTSFAVYLYFNEMNGVSFVIFNSALSLGIYLPLSAYIPKTKSFEIISDASHDTLSSDQISSMANAFTDISNVMYSAADTMKKDNKMKVMESVYASIDEKCNNCGKCNLNISDLKCTLLETLREKGSLDYDTCPKYFISKCIKKDQIINSANAAFKSTSDDCSDNSDIIAQSCASFSEILKSKFKTKENENKKNRKLSTKAMCCLSMMGIKGDKIVVYGTRDLTVCMYNVNPEALTYSMKEIRNKLQEAFGVSLSMPKLIAKGTKHNMILRSVPRIKIDSSQFSITKKGEKLCGDTIRTVKTNNGLSFFLICDGMGSGKDASLSSGIAAKSLENLLSIGVEKETAVKTVNTMLVSSSDETFTTVDLLEIDTYTQKASILKSGAAPTYIVSDGNITKSESRTLPIGVLGNVKLVQTELEIKRGDYIIMVSDGAIPTESDENKIISSIARYNYSNSKELSLSLYETVRENKTDSDDISFCVIHVA